MALIQISDLTFSHAGSYDPVFEHVSFSMDSHWKLGLIGRNGRGKTTLLQLLLGRYPYQGTIHSAVPFAYFPFTITRPQDATMDVMEAICPQIQGWQLGRELRKLGLNADDVLYRSFSTLSQGEQTKVMLAALFLNDHPFLLIDEPTNHLDTLGRQHVARYLQSKKGFIVVSHDRAFLDGCVDHILCINRTNIEVQHGNFSSWYTNKQRQDTHEQAVNEQLQKDIGRLQHAAQQTCRRADRIEASKIGHRSQIHEKSIGTRVHR